MWPDMLFKLANAWWFEHASASVCQPLNEAEVSESTGTFNSKDMHKCNRSFTHSQLHVWTRGSNELQGRRNKEWLVGASMPLPLPTASNTIVARAVEVVAVMYGAAVVGTQRLRQ